MSLLQNITLRTQYPIRENGGTTGFERSSVGRLERQMNRFAGDGGVSVLAAIPYGYLPPYALALPRSSGGIGSTGNLYGVGATTTGNLAGGLNAVAALVGAGSVAPAPTAQLLLWMTSALMGAGTVTQAIGVPVAVAIAALVGSGTVTGATLLGQANAVAALVGEGTISNAAADAIMTAALLAALTGAGGLTTTDLNALGEAIAALVGDGSVTNAAGVNTRPAEANLTGSGAVSVAAANALGHLDSLLTGGGSAAAVVRALGELEASILSYGALTPEGIRDAVWMAAAANYLVAGTMGKKVNDAGGAANPWEVVLDNGLMAAEMMRLILAMLAGDIEAYDIVKAFNDASKTRLTYVTDESGNRTLQSFDASE